MVTMRNMLDDVGRERKRGVAVELTLGGAMKEGFALPTRSSPVSGQHDSNAPQNHSLVDVMPISGLTALVGDCVAGLILPSSAV